MSPSLLISKLMYDNRCPNSDTGCEDVISVDDMQRHVMLECGYVKVHCRYEDCPKSEEQGDTVFRKDLEEHMQLCTYRPVECSLNCGEVIPFWYQADHCSDECLMYMSECRCGAMVARKDEVSYCVVCLQLTIARIRTKLNAPRPSYVAPWPAATRNSHGNFWRITCKHHT